MNYFETLCHELGWLPTGDFMDGVAVHSCTPIGNRTDCLLFPNPNLFYYFWGPASTDNPSFIIAGLFFFTTAMFFGAIWLVGIAIVIQERGIPTFPSSSFDMSVFCYL